jgi:hypothetical protein
MKDLYEVSLGQLAELIEEARLREVAPVGNADSSSFEELKLAVRDLSVEALYLVKRLESEFDESSDPGAIDACLANHFDHIGREMARIKQLRNDPLPF